jgi:hypothetical protein
MKIVEMTTNPLGKSLFTVTEAGKLLFPYLSEKAAYQRLRRILASGDYDTHSSGRTTYLARHELKRLGANLN